MNSNSVLSDTILSQALDLLEETSRPDQESDALQEIPYIWHFDEGEEISDEVMSQACNKITTGNE